MNRPQLLLGLIAGARERGFPVVTVGGAGGRRDATRLDVARDETNARR